MTMIATAATTPPVSVQLGLDAHEIECELQKIHRAGDISRYGLAFYLHDLERGGKHQELGFSSALHFAVESFEMKRQTAAEYITVGRALTELPLIDEAFRQGRINWSRTKLLTRVATVENEERWLERALKLNCRRLEAEIRGADKGRPPGSGKGTPTTKFEVGARLGVLDYEVFEQAKRKLFAKAGTRLSDAEVIRAMARAVLEGQELEGEGGGGAGIFRVAVQECPTCHDNRVETEDGPTTIARMPAGEVDRPTPPAMRSSVLARDGYRCHVCRGDSTDLHAHHIDHRSDGGRTVEENLITICAQCHGMLHDGLIKISGSAPHRLEVTDDSDRPLAGHLPIAPISVAVNAARAASDVMPVDEATDPEHFAARAAAREKNPALEPARATYVSPLGERENPSAVELRLLAEYWRAVHEERMPRNILLESDDPFRPDQLALALAKECDGWLLQASPRHPDRIQAAIPDGTVVVIDRFEDLPEDLLPDVAELMARDKVCVFALMASGASSPLRFDVTLGLDGLVPTE